MKLSLFIREKGRPDRHVADHVCGSAWWLDDGLSDVVSFALQDLKDGQELVIRKADEKSVRT